MQSKNRHSKVSLAELTARKQFIPGICNFCDKWCERCPKTQHCLSYAHDMVSKGLDFSENNKDSANADFWHAFDQYLGWKTNSCKQIKKPPQRDFSLLHLGDEYAKKSNDWMASKRSSFSEYLDKVMIENPGNDITFSEMVEILEWYRVKIPIKLTRALNEYDLRKNFDPEDEKNPFKDNIGSAKMALIACNRSYIAFCHVLKELPDEVDSIVEIISILFEIKDQITMHFPTVNDFVRPGFDN